MLREYRKNGVSTITIEALQCLSRANSWIHCATLKSKPSIEIYTNLLTWDDNSMKINCKIDVDGKVYFRSGTTGDYIFYYGTVNFS